MEADSSTSSKAPTLEAWLEEHGELERACATGLLSLVEPFGGFVGIKAVGTGRYVFASAGLAALFECAEIVGRTDAELLKAEETSGLRRAEQTAMAQRTVLINEHRLDVRGRKREFSVTRCALGEGYLLAVWQDRTEDKLREGQLQRALTQIEELQAQLESLRREMESGSGRDEVSGLYLRAQFDDSLRREIDLSQREHREFALVIIALDPRRRARWTTLWSSACSKAWGACCGPTPGRWMLPAAWMRVTLRCCCRASGLPPHMRAWSSCGGSATPSSWSSTGWTWACRCRWAFPASRTRLPAMLS